MPSGASASQSTYPSFIMYSTNCWEAATSASAPMTNATSSPNWVGLPAGPPTAVTIPLLFARNMGSAVHSSQVGSASLRSPASSSSRNEDQMIIAASPAK